MSVIRARMRTRGMYNRACTPMYIATCMTMCVRMESPSCERHSRLSRNQIVAPVIKRAAVLSLSRTSVHFRAVGNNRSKRAHAARAGATCRVQLNGAPLTHLPAHGSVLWVEQQHAPVMVHAYDACGYSLPRSSKQSASSGSAGRREGRES